MQTATARKKTSRKPPPVACEQTTIRTTVADRTIALTGDRTRLVRVVIAPGSPSGKTPPEPLRLAMALPVAEYTRKLPNGTSVTAQQRIAWKRVGGSAREGVVVDGSAAHAAVIAACAEYEIEVHQHAAEPEGRFVILRDAALMALLNATSRSLGGPKGVPMFTNVCLTAQGAELRARTTDCILAVDIGAAATVGAPGSACVEHRLFCRIIGGMPEGDVRLRVQGMTLGITAPRRKATLSCHDGQDFPSSPSCNSPLALRVDAVLFRALLARVAPLSSDDDGRPHLAGVYLRGGEGRLLMVTTNGHALAKDHLSVDGIPSFHTIVPNAVVREVLHALCEVEGEVLLEISKASGRVRLTVGECRLLGPLVDAAFPSWEQVVPSGSNNQIHVDVAALSQALKSLVTLAVSDKIRSGCEIAFDKAAGEMLIAARSEMGSQEARVPAETTGEVPKFGMSRNLLTAALDACASKRVRIGMGRELDPFLFTSDERPDFAAVVMPQRI